MEFVCRLGTTSGEVVTRTIEGLSESELRQRLQSEGYRIFNVETSQVMDGVRIRTKGSGSIRIKVDDFLIFNQQFAALLKAGLPVWLISRYTVCIRSPYTVGSVLW